MTTKSLIDRSIRFGKWTDSQRHMDGLVCNKPFYLGVILRQKTETKVDLTYFQGLIVAEITCLGLGRHGVKGLLVVIRGSECIDGTIDSITIDT